MGHTSKGAMSALGQKRTWRGEIAMSALPPKADIAERNWDVRFVANSGHTGVATCLRLNPDYGAAGCWLECRATAFGVAE
jgi:hypothetical protein